jgi:outer membrane lipoprotein-sorting protein
MMMIRWMKTYVGFFTLAVALSLFPGPAAWAARAIDLTPDQVQSINQISAYLNSFATMQGEFTQISPRGTVSKGQMFISKPGKIRFEYAPPNPFLLVSDGTWVTLKNRAKETGDQFPLNSTPLRLVVAPRIDLLQETNVLGFEQADGLTSVVVEDRKGTMGGQIVLVFDQAHNQLQQWVVIDGKGRRTTVTLANLSSGVKIDPRLFQVKIVRKEKDAK